MFGFDEITAEHVILVSFDGEVLVGDLPRHIEWPIHTEVMRARADVSGVVHSHPPHAIALCARGRPLRAICTRRRCSCRLTCRATRAPGSSSSPPKWAPTSPRRWRAARLPARQPRDRDRRRGRARRSHPRCSARERGPPADADRGVRRRVARLCRRRGAAQALDRLVRGSSRGDVDVLVRRLEGTLDADDAAEQAQQRGRSRSVSGARSVSPTALSARTWWSKHRPPRGRRDTGGSDASRAPSAPVRSGRARQAGGTPRRACRCRWRARRPGCSDRSRARRRAWPAPRTGPT